MKINFYGSIGTSSVIKQADTNVYQIGEGLRDSDAYLETLRTIPDPIDASSDSDYGFLTTYLDSAT